MKKYRTMKKKDDMIYLLLLLPLIIAFLVTIISPIIVLFLMSFYDWSIDNPTPGFIGLANYFELLFDGRFWHSVKIAMHLCFGATFFQILIGLGVALFLTSLKRFSNLLTSLLLIPMILPQVAVGLTWKILFTPHLGGINYYLSLFGLPQPDWLGDYSTALYSLIIAATWQWTPFVIIALFAALQSLPPDVFEQAKIDGASGLQRLIYITLPLLKPAISTVLVLRIIFGMKYFALVYTLTGGGPARATEPMNFYGFMTAFQYGKFSYAASIGVVTFFIVFGLVIGFHKLGLR